jgi:transcriptional regulator with XRE-family HTH domain
MKSLRKHMKKARLSQSELARRVEVSQPTIWAWLNGRKSPTVDNLVRLSNVTGLSVDELLGRKAA